MSRGSDVKVGPRLLVDATATTELGEYDIGSWSELEQHVASIVERQYGTAYYYPQSCPGEHLLVGVEGEAALAFYDPWHQGPYLWATNGIVCESIEFDFAGTGTSIPAHRCITIDAMWKALSHFFSQGELYPGIRWQEDDA